MALVITTTEKTVTVNGKTQDKGGFTIQELPDGYVSVHNTATSLGVRVKLEDISIDGVVPADYSALLVASESFTKGGGDGSTGVASVSGTLVDNTDPDNPVIGLPTWGQVSGKPTTFAPSAHTHEISDVNGLQTELTSKQDSSTALQIGTTASTAKAGNYQPTWGQVTGKPSTFPPTQADILSYLLSLPGGDTAGNILTVNATADGVEWVTPA